MSIIIRQLEARDREQWEALFQAYNRHYHQNVPSDVIDTVFGRLVAQEDGFLALVADDGARGLVALAHLLFHRSTWSPTVYCYLEDLFVDIDTRRQGVGRALIEVVYREADKRGATRTYWVTKEDNNTARRLFGRLANLSPFVVYRR